MKHLKNQVVDFSVFSVLVEKIDQLTSKVDSLQEELRIKKQEELTYTTIEAASLLKKSPKTIRRWIQIGILEAKDNGGTYLIYRSALERFLNPGR